MALPKWITPAGNLGIVPELEYYDFTLDAYDDAGGTLVYSFISGKMPPGIQLVSTGALRGIPVSTTFSDFGVAYSTTSDLNQTYSFTIRVTNANDGAVSDRTFTLTITNVAPPIITPKTNKTSTKLTLTGTISANINDIIAQSISGANAIVLADAVNTSTINVLYNTITPFVLGYGNLNIISGNILNHPSVGDAHCYPIGSQISALASTRNLGIYFDGDLVDLQLEALEFIPGGNLTWSLKGGVIPPGLSLSPEGLISGYIYPIPIVGPASTPGWDKTPWDEKYLTGSTPDTATLGWDFAAGVTSKGFSFTIEVSDGVTFDLCTYQIFVIPRKAFEADSTLLTVDATIVEDIPLTVDHGPKHYPIILSQAGDIPAERQNSWFSFHFNAIDIDGDTLIYSVPNADAGLYDEQEFTGASVPYIASPLINGKLYSGVFPKTIVTYTSTIINIKSGSVISANVGEYITQPLSGANARVVSNAVATSSITVVSITGGSFKSGSGNLYIGGVDTALYPISLVTGAPSVSFDYSAAGLLPNSVVQVLNPYTNPSTEQTYFTWYEGTTNSNVTIQLTGNTIISGNIGGYITQAQTGANALISNISATTAEFTIGGNLIAGIVTLEGNLLTANVGDVLTQASTSSNATVTATVVSSVVVPVVFTKNQFAANTIINPGNLLLNGNTIGALGSFPISVLVGNATPVSIVAYEGDVIYQASTGATANVTALTPGATVIPVVLTSGTFATGASAGNITINGNITYSYPVDINSHVEVEATYTNSSVFVFNAETAAAVTYINGISTGAIPTELTSVGVDLSSAETQGVVGYDEGKYDQGVISLPGTLKIDANSGWMTGRLPIQSINEVDYNFQVLVKKAAYPEYISSRYFDLKILGDLNNTINWLTPINLGTIENGRISDLSVKALSSKGKTLYYSLTPSPNYNIPRSMSGYSLNAYNVNGTKYTIQVPSYMYPYSYSPGSYYRLPQGMELTSNGLLSGRVSFEVFGLDHGSTTLDVTSRNGKATTFDNTYTFSVTASDSDQSIAATRLFTIQVVQRNPYPYEDLYLKAYLNQYQRTQFQDIVRDSAVFPSSLIYRNEDPYFGIAKDLKALFLAGLNPNILSKYANATSTNHYAKRITLGRIKTAIASDSTTYDVADIATGEVIGTFKDLIGFVPTDFSMGYVPSSTIPPNAQLTNEHVKYEVVYVEVFDSEMNALGQGPADIQYPAITNPYFDLQGNAYVTAYPNAFTNMDTAIVNNIGYANKGALPDWMTSKQLDGRVLGFTRAVVLAYAQPGAGATIAYRFAQAGFDLNQLDFTVDRYELDNNYTDNFKIAKNVILDADQSIIGTWDYTQFTPNFYGAELGYLPTLSIPSDTTVDYSSNAGAFIASNETTFDRLPALPALQTLVASVDYAVNVPFEQINQRSVAEIYKQGGLDGIKSFSDGQTLVFFNQEFINPGAATSGYNDGWNIATAIWDMENWDWDNDTPLIGTDDLGWDASGYVLGYQEWLAARINVGTAANPIYYYPVANRRIGVWTVNVSSENIVTLTFKQEINFDNTVYVRNGITHSGQRIYYDRSTASGLNTIPHYSLLKNAQTVNVSASLTAVIDRTGQVTSVIINSGGSGYKSAPNLVFTGGQGAGAVATAIVQNGSIVGIRLTSGGAGYISTPYIVATVFTTFDNNSTRFFNYRDSYSVPEQGDKYIKFAKTGVFT